jgi:hypothetical protein
MGLSIEDDKKMSRVGSSRYLYSVAAVFLSREGSQRGGTSPDTAVADAAFFLVNPAFFRKRLARKVEHYADTAKCLGRCRTRLRLPE